jgi:hypothetical protein
MPSSTVTRSRAVRAYFVASALAILGLGAMAFRPNKALRLEEITVERINVVERDGTVRLVIANRDRSPGSTIRGKQWGTPGNKSGLVFYNEEGTEAGGLIFSGKRLPDGTFYHSVSLTMDRYEQDQTIALQHYEESGGPNARQTNALTIFDRPAVPLDSLALRRRAIDSMPEGPRKAEELRKWREFQGGMEWAAPRLYVGRGRNRASLVNLYDPNGRLKLRLQVDSLGEPAIEFLNDSGTVVRRIRARG